MEGKRVVPLNVLLAPTRAPHCISSDGEIVEKPFALSHFRRQHVERDPSDPQKRRWVNRHEWRVAQVRRGLEQQGFSTHTDYQTDKTYYFYNPSRLAEELEIWEQTPDGVFLREQKTPNDVKTRRPMQDFIHVLSVISGENEQRVVEALGVMTNSRRLVSLPSLAAAS